MTPNKIIHLKGPEPPICQFDESDSFSRKRYRQIQVLAQDFWRRWSTEYVTELQRRQKWSTTSKNLAVGDVVLAVDPTTPRTHWPVARVIEIKRSNDGLVRSATIKSIYWTLVHPVNKLVKLFTPET